MDTLQQGIITLIKSAVTGEKLSLPEGFRLEDAEELINKQSVLPLAYQGAFQCGVPSGSEIMQRFFQCYIRVLMHHERQMAAIDRLFRAFEENEIDYMPLKGVNMKACYPKPELRVMGDADVLIRQEQYEKIVPIMESLGYQEGVETDHELQWNSPALFLELHKRLIPSYNVDYYAYFGDGWKLAKTKEGFRYSMTAEDAYIYQFSHFAKHYRDGGIGCRHVTDLWVYRRANPVMDESYIGRELDKLQLREFHENMCRLLDVWFDDAPTDDKTDFITDYIFASGNFGSMNAHLLSEGILAAKNTRFVGMGRLKQMRKALFPDHSEMVRKYPVLKAHPILLPIFWVIRIFDKLLFQRDMVERRRRSLQVYTKENVDSRRKALNYVGLDYNF